MGENKQVKACAECMEHGIMALKLGQLCQWKESHEIGTNKWRTRMEDEMADHKLESLEVKHNIEEKIDKKINTLKTWAIANLSAVGVTLLALLANLIYKSGP